MLLVFSPCNFTQVAVREILREITVEGDCFSLLVMDSRAFESMTKMHDAVISFSRTMASPKVMVIMSNSFIKTVQGERTHQCSINIKDSLSSLRECLLISIRENTSMDISLNWISYYSGRNKFTKKDYIIINLIREGLSIKDISRIIKRSDKSVYSWLNAKKIHYKQDRLVDLLRLFKSWDI